MADLREVIKSGELKQRKYHQNRLQCEDLGLRVVPLNENSFERRVKLNLDQIRNHLHPKGDIAYCFVLTEEMLKPIDIVDIEIFGM